MDNEIVLTACAIIPGLMERRREQGYSDDYAVHEAYRLAEDYFSHTRKTSKENIESPNSADVEPVDRAQPTGIQQTKVANCHLWEAGKQCEFVTGWVCLDQCCAIPPISNRL